jgi:ethanolamine utilization protein EutN
MQLARVIGTVVATVKNDSLEGRKLLVVQTLNKDLEPIGKPMVAIDSVGAGVGELVFWCRGKEASFPFKREDTPTDCTIVGIVDSDAHVTQGSRAGFLPASSETLLPPGRTSVTTVQA